MLVHVHNHFILPGKVEQAKDLFRENGRVLATIPGLISRQVLMSKNDPLRWTGINVWENDEAPKVWYNHPGHIHDETAFRSPSRKYDSITASVVQSLKDDVPGIPPESDYYKKYGPNPGTVQSKPPESDWFEPLSD